MLRKKLGILIAGAVAGGLLAGAGIASAGPNRPVGQQAAEGITVLHWNMAGAITATADQPNKPNNAGRLKPVGTLVRAIEATRPQVVSVNEICHSQYTHLVKELAARGINGTANFEPTSVPGINCNGLAPADWYAGNLVFTTAAARDEKDYYFDGANLTDSRTRRGGACLTAQFNRPVRVCSFHLAESAAKEPPGPVAQATTFVNRFRADIVNSPHLLIGDFNATPAELLSLMYAPGTGNGEFYEADMDAAGMGKPTQNSRKIDYVFASHRHFARQLSTEIREPGICYTPHPCSDHRIMIARMSLL